MSGCVSDSNDQPHTTRAMVACTQPAGRKVMRRTMAGWMRVGVGVGVGAGAGGVVADPPEMDAPCR